MTDYISREAAIEACCGGCNPAMCSYDCDEVAAIRVLPTADVREVVTCGNCASCEKADDFEWWCAGRGFPKVLTTADDYCSHGRVDNG